MRSITIKSLTLLVILSSPVVLAGGNTSIESFSKAKRLMQQSIFIGEEFQKTFYCSAAFNQNKEVTLPSGFITTKHMNRLKKWEAEHVLSSENLGRSFVEWREGHPKCIDSKGKSFKGRRCTTKVNKEFRLMQADLYNLQPSLGAVNAARQNYNFTMLPQAKSNFGSCDMRIDNRKVQPPEIARGQIARTYLYMEDAYQSYTMSSSQRKLMKAWDRQYPVTDKECEIARRIEIVQKSKNNILALRCH